KRRRGLSWETTNRSSRLALILRRAGRSQVAIDARHPDTEAPGDLLFRQPLGRELLDLAGLAPRGRLPALELAGRLCRLDAVALTLEHDLALEFGDRTNDVEKQ